MPKKRQMVDIICPLCGLVITWDTRHTYDTCPRCSHVLKVYSGGYVAHLAFECDLCKMRKAKVDQCWHAHWIVVSETFEGLRGMCLDCDFKGPVRQTVATARRAFARKVKQLNKDKRNKE